MTLPSSRSSRAAPGQGAGEAAGPPGAAGHPSAGWDERVLTHFRGGLATCLTLLVQHTLSSKVANNAANSLSRVRQLMP